MKHNILCLVALLAIAVALFSVAGAAPAKATNLNGVWTCDDGGKYYLRQISNTLWWYGEQKIDKPQWSNVAYGTINGENIYLQWMDVPKGKNRGGGALKLITVSDNELVAIKKTGGFGGLVWKK